MWLASTDSFLPSMLLLCLLMKYGPWEWHLLPPEVCHAISKCSQFYIRLVLALCSPFVWSTHHLLVWYRMNLPSSPYDVPHLPNSPQYAAFLTSTLVAHCLPDYLLVASILLVRGGYFPRLGIILTWSLQANPTRSWITLIYNKYQSQTTLLQATKRQWNSWI